MTGIGRRLALTAHKEVDVVYRAFRAGVDGYLVKDASFAELLVAARALLQGQKYVGAAVCAPVVQEFLAGRDRSQDRGGYEELNPRERQVLKLLAEGYPNRRIADLLSVSVKTVEKAGTSLRKKLGLRSLADLTRFAAEKGLVSR